MIYYIILYYLIYILRTKSRLLIVKIQFYNNYIADLIFINTSNLERYVFGFIKERGYAKISKLLLYYKSRLNQLHTHF
jgi:hypothetical protein